MWRPSQSKQWVDGSVGQMGQFFGWVIWLYPGPSWSMHFHGMTRLHIYRKHVVKATFVVGFLTHLSSVYVSHGVTEIEQCCIFIRVSFTYCVLLAAWRSGYRSSSMNEVNARLARLQLGLVTVFERV